MLIKLVPLILFALLTGCDERSFARPNPRLNSWNHVINVLTPNEAVADITNDGGPGWVKVEVIQDGISVGSTRAYFTAGQQQVVKTQIRSSLWKLEIITTLSCCVSAD